MVSASIVVDGFDGGFSHLESSFIIRDLDLKDDTIFHQDTPQVLNSDLPSIISRLEVPAEVGRKSL